MKRIVAIFALIVLVASFSSCHIKDDYSVLEIGGNDYISEANHKEELVLVDEKYNKALVKRERTISINLVDYDTAYEYSKKDYLYRNNLDIYSMLEDGVYVQFGINSDTGRIDKYTWSDFNYVDSIQKEKVARERCLGIAKEYLGNYINDVSEYDLISERYLEIPEYDAIYDFEFSRVIDGVKTSDSAYVGVTVYGDVISHLFVSLGEMENAHAPSKETIQIINSNVEKKIESIYSDIADDYSVKYDYDDIEMIRLSDGKYAMLYYVDAELTSKSYSAKVISELTKLLVYLD